MTVRESERRHLEILTQEPTVGLPLEVLHYSGGAPNTALAYLEHATDIAWQEQLNDVGAAGIIIPLDDAKGAAVGDGDILRFQVGGVPRFGCFVEAPAVVSAAEAEKNVRKLGGRGLLAYLERTVVYPSPIVSPLVLDLRAGGTLTFPDGTTIPDYVGWKGVKSPGKTEDGTKYIVRVQQHVGGPILDATYPVDHCTIVGQAPSPSERSWTNTTVGTILVTFINESQARGDIPFVTLGFDAVHDASGDEWPADITFSIAVGTTLLDVVRKLTALGACEVKMGVWFRFDAYRSMARHMESTVIFTAARHILGDGISRTGRLAGLKTRVLVAGSGGTYLLVGPIDPALEADPAIGIRVGSLSMTSTADPTTLQRAGEAYLAASKAETESLTVEVTHDDGAGGHSPWGDHQLGDWVALDAPPGYDREPERIVQWAFAGVEADWSETLTMNCVALEAGLRLQRQLDALAQTGAGASTTASNLTIGTPAVSGAADGKVVVEVGQPSGYLFDKVDAGDGLAKSVVGGQLRLDAEVTQAELDAVSAVASNAHSDAAAAQATADAAIPATEKGAANGVATLGASGRVPMAQLASGTPDGTKYVRDDGTLATPAGGPGGGLTIEEADGSPSVAATKLILPNGTLSLSGTEATYTPVVAGGGTNPDFEQPPASPDSGNEEFNATTLVNTWTWQASSGTPTNQSLGDWVDTAIGAPSWNANADVPGALVLMPLAGQKAGAYMAFAPAAGTKWAVAARVSLANVRRGSANQYDRVSLVLVKETPSASSSEATDGAINTLWAAGNTGTGGVANSVQPAFYCKNGGADSPGATGYGLVGSTMYLAFTGNTDNSITCWASSDGIGWVRGDVFSGKNINAHVNYLKIAVDDSSNDGVPVVGIIHFVRFLAGDNRLWKLGMGS